MLRCEIEVFVSRSEEHFASSTLAQSRWQTTLLPDLPDLNPVLIVVAPQQCLQLVSTSPSGRAILQSGR